MTEFEVAVGHSINVLCGGFFGDVALCGGDCAIGWTRHPLSNMSHQSSEVVGTKMSQRVYATNMM